MVVLHALGCSWRLKLAWAVSIHKAQGLTLDRAVLNIGKKEFCTGLTFVACSRVRRLADLLSEPSFDYDHVRSLGNAQRVQERRVEDVRLRYARAASTIDASDLHSPPMTTGTSAKDVQHQEPSPAADLMDSPTPAVFSNPACILRTSLSLPSTPDPMHSLTPSLPSNYIHSCTPSLPSTPESMH